MFSFIAKEGRLAVCLSEEDKKAYNEEYGTNNVVQHGAIMKGYVEATDTIIASQKMLKGLIESGLKFVSSLKPK